MEMPGGPNLFTRRRCIRYAVCLMIVTAVLVSIISMACE